MKWFLAALLFVVSAMPASAQDVPVLTGRDIKFHFASGQGPMRYYPQGALARHHTGIASALCTIDGDGILSDCNLVEESPEQEGFGEALLKLVEDIRIEPQTKDGQPTAGRKFLFHINFRIPG